MEAGMQNVTCLFLNHQTDEKTIDLIGTGGADTSRHVFTIYKITKLCEASCYHRPLIIIDKLAFD